MTLTKVVTEIKGSMNREESVLHKYESCAQIDARGVTAVTTGWLFPPEPARYASRKFEGNRKSGKN